jgi:hypothetical protein
LLIAAARLPLRKQQQAVAAMIVIAARLPMAMPAIAPAESTALAAPPLPAGVKTQAPPAVELPQALPPIDAAAPVAIALAPCAASAATTPA